MSRRKVKREQSLLVGFELASWSSEKESIGLQMVFNVHFSSGGSVADLRW